MGADPPTKLHGVNYLYTPLLRPFDDGEGESGGEQGASGSGGGGAAAGGAAAEAIEHHAQGRVLFDDLLTQASVAPCVVWARACMHVSV